MARASLAAVAIFASALVACDATPDLTFTPDDASIGGDAGARDGALSDGSPSSDASDDASMPGDTCPQAPPAGIDACCGKIECVGSACSNKCNQCQNKCTAKQVCCASGGAVSCADPDAGC